MDSLSIISMMGVPSYISIDRYYDMWSQEPSSTSGKLVNHIINGINFVIFPILIRAFEVTSKSNKKKKLLLDEFKDN